MFLSKNLLFVGSGTGPPRARVLITSAASMTMNTSSYDAYIYTGSGAATWTLPLVSGSTGYFQLGHNRGTGPITVQRASSDQVDDAGTLEAYTILAIGQSIQFVDNGTYWAVTKRY